MPASIVVVADCVFFGRTAGMLVFRNPHHRKNIYWHKIRTETTAEYRHGRAVVEAMGYTLQAIVLDGRKGIRDLFSDIPVQMCHFHQKAIINRYLTRHPKMQAGIELKAVVGTLCMSNEHDFTRDLEAWCEKWGSYIRERTIDPVSGRWHYTHKRLRAAYRSLKNNLPYLFTYLKYPDISIPNTTNSLDGSFAYLKELLRVHRGMDGILKEKLLVDILQK